MEPLFQRLRAQGQRLTVQRRRVLETLCEHPDHLSINQIQQYLAEHHSDEVLPLPTIYRIVQWLKEQGLVSQTDLGSAGIVYQIIGETPHHHLICLNCGACVDLDDGIFVVLRRELQTRYGFVPRIEHMAIYGLCAACAEQSSPGK